VRLKSEAVACGIIFMAARRLQVRLCTLLSCVLVTFVRGSRSRAAGCATFDSCPAEICSAAASIGSGAPRAGEPR